MEYDDIAPDGSEIGVILRTRDASSVQARLAAHTTSAAVCHRTVSEFWFCVRGNGELWRTFHDRDEITRLVPGLSAVIAAGTTFQWRNVADDALDVVIVTVPPWPGSHEAIEVEPHWPS